MVAAGLEIERDHLGDNVISRSPGAGHSEALADTVAGSSGRLWAEVTRRGPPVTSTSRPVPGQSRRWRPMAANNTRSRPDRHGITQGAFLYAFKPGGNEIEFFGDPVSFVGTDD